MDDGSEGLTDIDRAIAQALDVDPSAEFLARVRQRVAAEPMRVPLWRGWLLSIPIAAAAAVLVLMVVTRPAKPVMPTAATSASRPGSVAALREPSDEMPRLGRTDTPAARVRPRRMITTAPRSKEPEVLVPHEEIETYRRLIAHAQAVSAAVVVEAPADVAATRTFANITIDPITIDLITPPEGREGVRQ